MRNETKTWQIGDGLWSSSYGGELHAISADQPLGLDDTRPSAPLLAHGFCETKPTSTHVFKQMIRGGRQERGPRTVACVQFRSGGAKTHRRAASVATCSPETWAYSASVLAEQKRACALLAQGRELLKQMQAD